MADNEFNERTTTIINVAFKDQNDAPVVPTAARYAVHDVDDPTTALVPWTAIDLTGGPNNVDIELTPDQMRILDDTHAKEPRCLTAQWEWGSGRNGYDQYVFNVLNLQQAPRP